MPIILCFLVKGAYAHGSRIEFSLHAPHLTTSLLLFLFYTMYENVVCIV
jgi:hypothetical protein